MSKLSCVTVVFALCFSSLAAGQASGSYTETGGQFPIAYAVAERDIGSDAVRILLAQEAPPVTLNPDPHLDRLEAICGAVNGGCLIVEPTPGGEQFNITLRTDALGSGGGGQYPSQIEIGEENVTGQIDTDALSGQLAVTFEADYLPPREVQGPLPVDGGEPGAVLLAQMEAIASGDREAILATLTDEQREMFAELSAEEQEEALGDAADFAPTNPRITGGVLYDGYAIVEYQAEMFGEPAEGRALLVQDGDQWQVVEVSTSG